MVFSSEEYRTINELRADEYRNYLPYDLHNKKNNSNFAAKYFDSSVLASSLAHYHL